MSWHANNPYAAAALLKRAHEETGGEPERMLAWLATRAVVLAEDVCSLADAGGMPDSFKQTDSRMLRAGEVLDP